MAGRLTGLIEKGETVTWRAKHLGVWQNLTSIITDCEYPTFFVDEMVNGAFKRFRHEHKFIQQGEITVMTDTFDFDSPFGFFGVLANKFFLTKYLTGFLIQRNRMIKDFAENGKYKAILPA